MAKSAGSKNQEQFSARDLKGIKQLAEAPEVGLHWYYSIGKQVKKLVPKKEDHYQRAKMDELSERVARMGYFAWHELEPRYVAQVLYATRDFATKYKAQELAGLNNLSWSHVRWLLAVDEKTRDRLQQRCIKQGWKVRELRLAIRDKQVSTSKRGRPPQSLKDLGPMAALQETIHLSQQWLRSCPEWLERNEDKLGTITKQDAEGTLLMIAVAALQKLEISARQLRRKLQKLRS